MPLEHAKNEESSLTVEAVAADLRQALGIVQLARTKEAQKRISQGVVDNFAAYQKELVLYPQYPEEAKRHLITTALATLPDAQMVLANAGQWLRRAASPQEFTGEGELAERGVVKEAVTNFALLSASRRLNDMCQFGAMTIGLLNRETINPESQAQLLVVIRQLLYAKPINAAAAGSSVDRENQAKLLDFRNDLLRRLLFDVQPEILVTPASQAVAAVNIDLDTVEVEEGVPPKLLEAEVQLLATIAHMSNQEFETFLKQQLLVYTKTQERLTELLKVITRLKTLRSSILGRGEAGESAIMLHNEELNGLPKAVAVALEQKIAGLCQSVEGYQTRRPITGEQAA